MPPHCAQLGPVMQLAADSPNQGQAERIPGMANRRGGLPAQIEADLLDDRVPLSSLLQRCVVLGRQAGSEKLRDWAR
jgi:AbiTii